MLRRAVRDSSVAGNQPKESPAWDGALSNVVEKMFDVASVLISA
jgi:hypothetical protein